MNIDEVVKEVLKTKLDKAGYGEETKIIVDTQISETSNRTYPDNYITTIIVTFRDITINTWFYTTDVLLDKREYVYFDSLVSELSGRIQKHALEEYLNKK